MLMHTREGTTIVTQQEKLKTIPDNRWTIYFKGSALFGPFCCRESFITYLQRAVFIFVPDKPSWATPTFSRRYIFWKFDTSPEKSTTNRSLEFFLKLVSRYNRLYSNSTWIKYDRTCQRSIKIISIKKLLHSISLHKCARLPDAQDCQQAVIEQQRP